VVGEARVEALKDRDDLALQIMGDGDSGKVSAKHNDSMSF
jgi:hypothetical protein